MQIDIDANFHSSSTLCVKTAISKTFTQFEASVAIDVVSIHFAVEAGVYRYLLGVDEYEYLSIAEAYQQRVSSVHSIYSWNISIEDRGTYRTTIGQEV